MSTENKIKEEELKELQEVVNKINNAQLKVGQLETQKHFILHELANVQDELKVIQDKLEKEYGKVSVNIVDGTFKAIEDEQADT